MVARLAGNISGEATTRRGNIINEAMRQSAVAKATYLKTRGIWRVFWQRRNLKWHSYEPRPKVKSVAEFASLVSEDAHACFFG
jgi:hypothetical protein